MDEIIISRIEQMRDEAVASRPDLGDKILQKAELLLEDLEIMYDERNVISADMVRAAQRAAISTEDWVEFHRQIMQTAN